MVDCIFCRIVRGEINSNKVYEDDQTLAFHDINPQAPVHILIIPKEHLATLLDLEGNPFLIGKLIETAIKVSRLVGVDERGFRIVVNCKEEGGQLIEHLHLHLLGGKRLSDKIA